MGPVSKHAAVTEGSNTHVDEIQVADRRVHEGLVRRGAKALEDAGC